MQETLSPLADPVALSQALIRIPSLTPDGGAGVAAIEALLRPLGFACMRLDFGDTANLYAELRESDGPNLCFAGHTDVVPPGDSAAWTVDPFAAEIRGGMLYGRGACDMKSGIAAFMNAVHNHLNARAEMDLGPLPGALSLLITGDEEGPAVNGTERALDALVARGVVLDACIVGEPTSEVHPGDTIKTGRRGSLNIAITATGQQAHVAYPHKGANALGGLLAFLDMLRTDTLDEGAEGFQPSNLEITSAETSSSVFNVLPARASAKANIRFNTAHTRASLIARIEAHASTFNAENPVQVSLAFTGSGEAFYSRPGKLVEALAEAVVSETGRHPELSTGGGTSDARFIQKLCPVAELGLRNETAHKVDEHVAVDDIETLARIYTRAIGSFFD